MTSSTGTHCWSACLCAFEWRKSSLSHPLCNYLSAFFSALEWNHTFPHFTFNFCCVLRWNMNQIWPEDWSARERVQKWEPSNILKLHSVQLQLMSLDRVFNLCKRSAENGHENQTKKTTCRWLLQKREKRTHRNWNCVHAIVKKLSKLFCDSWNATKSSQSNRKKNPKCRKKVWICFHSIRVAQCRRRQIGAEKRQKMQILHRSNVAWALFRGREPFCS